MIVNDTDIPRMIELARKHGGEELGRLLDGYRNYLTLLARGQVARRVQGKLDPADIVQETYLSAAQSFPKFRGTTEAELIAWLRSILSARLVDHMRRYLGTQSRDVRLEAELTYELERSSQALLGSLASPESTPSQRAARRELAVLLSEAIRGLPADYEEVIVLHHLEGLSFPEVAARMERSVEAVKKLWVRALTKLRRRMGNSE